VFSELRTEPLEESPEEEEKVPVVEFPSLGTVTVVEDPLDTKPVATYPLGAVADPLDTVPVVEYPLATGPAVVYPLGDAPLLGYPLGTDEEYLESYPSLVPPALLLPAEALPPALIDPVESV